MKKIWKEAHTIAEYMYECIGALPRDEEFASASKLRTGANDLVFYIGQAAEVPLEVPSAVYDWVSVARAAGGLKSTYIFLSKQDMAELDPEVVVKLDKIIRTSNNNYRKAVELTSKKADDELKPWLKKYKLWKEMQ